MTRLPDGRLLTLSKPPQYQSNHLPRGEAPSEQSPQLALIQRPRLNPLEQDRSDPPPEVAGYGTPQRS